jgi:hypothetical protein
MGSPLGKEGSIFPFATPGIKNDDIPKVRHIPVQVTY